MVKWYIKDVKRVTNMLKSGMNIRFWGKHYWKANFSGQKHILARASQVNILQDQSPSTVLWSQRSGKQWPLAQVSYTSGIFGMPEVKAGALCIRNVSQWKDAILEVHMFKKMIIYGDLNEKVIGTLYRWKCIIWNLKGE